MILWKVKPEIALKNEEWPESQFVEISRVTESIDANTREVGDTD